MAKRTDGFNLSETIRNYRKAHRGVSARNAFEGIKKAHPAAKINEGTFKSTFYKLAGGGKTKSVRRPKPGRLVAGHDGPEAIMRAGLQFIQLAGGVEAARERLVGLKQLIEVAKAAD
jgi:hypothetical protein